MNSNRVVVITGAAGGIGSELVERFLGNGDTVIGCDLDGDVLARWRRRWDDGEGTEHPRLAIVAADVSSETDCEAIARDSWRECRRFGQLCRLVSSAALR